MSKNCGNCNWHTQIDRTNGKKNTYCEHKGAWVGIDETCDDFQTYEYGKGDSERRATAKQHQERKDRQSSLKWQKIAVVIAVIAVLIAFIRLCG